MKAIAKKNKRRAARTALDRASEAAYPINMQTLTECRGKICDISPLGTKFISYMPYKEDSLVHIGLSLVDFGSSIETRGKIVRCEQKNCEEYHIALEFKNDDNQKNLIEEYIDVMKSWKKYNKSALAVLKS